jgi:hypothetical protein
MKNRNNSLDFLSKCSFCGGDFDPNRLTLLEEGTQKTILHATCPSCKTSAIFFLSNNQSGMVTLGMATDLDDQEVASKFSEQAVSADEVLDVHQFLNEYEGDFLKLIKK